jgi:hypothetical protein
LYLLPAFLEPLLIIRLDLEEDSVADIRNARANFPLVLLEARTIAYPFLLDDITYAQMSMMALSWG